MREKEKYFFLDSRRSAQILASKISPSSPIVTLPVQQGLSVAVQVSYWVLSPHSLLFIIQSNEEGRLLNNIQWSFVNARAEVLLPHLSPRDPGGGGWFTCIKSSANSVQECNNPNCVCSKVIFKYYIITLIRFEMLMLNIWQIAGRGEGLHPYPNLLREPTI